MKKLTFLVVAIAALFITSCKKDDYKSFIGTWGVEQIEYYNIDYAGNPIAASYSSYIYNPNDIDNGIQLIFREDKSGEMRDSAIDTLKLDNDDDGIFETIIYCPDTTLVYPFTYSYDQNASALYMTIKYSYPYDYTRTFLMKISNLTGASFIYENEYDINFVEKAHLKRLSKTPSKSGGRQTTPHPHMEGSFLGGR